MGEGGKHNCQGNPTKHNKQRNQEHSLRVFMATLRKKIEKNPSEPVYIQTHIGVGYRMIRIQDDTEN